MASPSNSYSLSGNPDSSEQDKSQASFARGGLNPAALKYMPPPRKARSSRRTPILLGVFALACVAVPGIAYFRAFDVPASAEASAPMQPTVDAAPAAAVAAPGMVSITSSPDGAQVVLDGELRGTTPLRLALPAGEYSLELRRGNVSRVLPITVEANSTIEPFADLSPSLAASGRLQITSDPPGAEVTINGTHRGTTPLVLAAVPAGRYRVALSDGTMTVNRVVDVVAGTGMSVSATMSRAASANGWVSVTSPLQMQVSAGGRVLGTTNERIALPVGTYELELFSAAFQFKTTVTARVIGQQNVDVPVQVPNGRLSVNAVPWAEVWMDGRSLGQTPLGQLSVPIGEHEIVWRHPQLGEKRQTVRITTDAVARVGVDFNR